jgi:sugar/nucleoside kinase (ribokinase family)
MARPRFDALAVGDAILDIVTPPLPPSMAGDRQLRVERFSYLPGGNATNFALAFSALGGRTGLVASVGRDWAGDALRRAYRLGRVDSRLGVSRTKPTGTTMAVTFADGTRHLITALGANADLRLSDVPAAWISGARHLHRAGYWWATGLIGPPTARLLARARGAGATTSLDIATDPEGWPEHRREAVRRVLRHVDVFFGNEEEVTCVAGETPLESAAEALLGMGVQEVVVHEGARGATLFTKAGVASAGAFPVAAVNPTGCGDVFNAAYVLASSAGADREHRLPFANAAAAWHLENVGKPYPTLRDLRARFRVSLPAGPGPRARR